MHTVIIGSPDDVRVNLFQHALVQQGYPPAEIAAYTDLIQGKIHLADMVKPGTLVRIESPGKNEAANQALLALGESEPDEDREYTRISPEAEIAKGRIAASRQWYLGLRAFMRMVGAQLAECPPHSLMNHPDDIITMFDKRACHAYLQNRGISVPPALPPISSFDELEAAMHATGTRRVFIKLAHGSSASGVVAYQINGNERRATGAIELVEVDGETQLFNTRRVQTYADHAQIVTLIDALCQQRVHVESWIPKARMGEKIFDLRVVVIGGEAAHTVARLSHNPMTNLHLLNERRDRETVIKHIGEANFDTAAALCCDAMMGFPNSLYAGIDLLVAPGFQKHYILEMNAFGDLLHDTLYQGVDTYSFELQRAACGQHAGNRRHA
jgi:glutathione synthase/RimK-type ligase-like ATP-grasp enzyme